ncbi:VOC family protein [Xanthomonas translucens pv. graminis]|uniref:VOC family protein n=1 Tax=Xanthomonas graminis TaxID=3390026 RepID=UPI0025409A05|nr:VOC family protein [Xanthomonas translucens]WIH05185.1 VOC family protein [Xanthomonas translucens pv. graminis]
MRSVQLGLPCSDPAASAAFYRDVLQLPVVASQVRIGWSQLELVATVDVGSVHLAFNIAAARFDAACDWLSRRVRRLRDPLGESRFALDAAWQSQSVYFAGPDGAVLELIARKPLPVHAAAAGAFSAAEVLCISEIGLPSAQVPAVAAAAQHRLGVPPFAPVSDVFAPLGDHEGLLVVVDAQRRWFPEQRQLPLAQGVRAVVAGVRGGQVLRDPAGWEVVSE